MRILWNGGADGENQRMEGARECQSTNSHLPRGLYLPLASPIKNPACATAAVAAVESGCGQHSSGMRMTILLCLRIFSASILLYRRPARCRKSPWLSEEQNYVSLFGLMSQCTKVNNIIFILQCTFTLSYRHGVRPSSAVVQIKLTNPGRIGQFEL